jgi:hypothetical protein
LPNLHDPISIKRRLNNNFFYSTHLALLCLAMQLLFSHKEPIKAGSKLTVTATKEAVCLS